jgi:hypothetical protein
MRKQVHPKFQNTPSNVWSKAYMGGPRGHQAFHGDVLGHFGMVGNYL